MCQNNLSCFKYVKKQTPKLCIAACKVEAHVFIDVKIPQWPELVAIALDACYCCNDYVNWDELIHHYDFVIKYATDPKVIKDAERIFINSSKSSINFGFSIGTDLRFLYGKNDNIF